MRLFFQLMCFVLGLSFGAAGAYAHDQNNEQRRAFIEKHYPDTSEEERAVILQNIENKYGHLSFEERAEKIQELKERRQALQQELESLPPGARRQRMEELRKHYNERITQQDDIENQAPLSENAPE